MFKFGNIFRKVFFVLLRVTIEKVPSQDVLSAI